MNKIFIIAIIIIILFPCVFIIINNRDNSVINNSFEYENECMDSVQIRYDDRDYNFSELTSINNFNIDDFIGNKEYDLIYRDGGRKVYKYKDFYVFRCNNVSGNKKIIFVGSECYKDINYCE